MRNRLIIIGAGGHGKVIADIALKNGYTDIVFADDKTVGSCIDIPIAYTSEQLQEQNDGNTDFIIAVGNNKVRQKIAEKYLLNWVTLVHPSAQIGMCVELGAGTVVMAGAVINSCATVGKHCIINTCAVVEHDNQIQDYVHISPNAVLGGTVCVGERTHIGIGAMVKNNVKICKNCTVGAGAVVVKNLQEETIYVGIPAKKMGGV